MRIRGRLALGRLRARWPTGPVRILPDFLIIGAQRCGTSSLYSYLGRHPDVIPSLRKETLYFSVAYPRGENWYRAHFPLAARRSLRKAAGRRLVTFEATPDYLLDHRAAQRAARLLPDARIIALFRNPADRAFSQYLHNVRLGTEPLSFEEALDREDERIEGELERLAADAEYPALRLRRYGYFARGRYAEQLVRWMEHYPPDRLMVISSEDFFARIPHVFQEILNFLDLPPWQLGGFRNYSYGRPRQRPTDRLSDSLRSRLVEAFAPYNQILCDLVGRNFAWD
jgi:hypothetical protein